MNRWKCWRGMPPSKAQDRIVAPQAALGLVPEVLDSVDVVALVGEQLQVVDPHVVEHRDIEHIVAAKGVGLDHAVGSDLLANDRNKRVRSFDTLRRHLR